MESIRLGNQHIYRIEVNDKGETIEFNLKDINLFEKVMKAEEDLRKETNAYRQKEIALSKQYANNKNLQMKKIIELDKEYYSKCRVIFDSFLGENACQKIFGDTNELGMFDELLEALEPHFKKMEINMKEIKKDIVAKYSPNNKKVI